MPNRSETLRAASDTMLRDLEALVVLEEQKRELDPADARFVALARQIEEIAGRILHGSQEQRSLTETIAADPAGRPSIAETPRSTASILAEWRELERRAAAAEPGSTEAAEVELLVARIRAEYAAAFEASREG
jgi:hypothetical protein